MRTTQAAILAIGTELTTGQITNRNAAWISERLTDLGVEVVLHETVADDRTMIFSALERCRQNAGLIFVTGGLGPTTDDFTRDVIAKWLGKPMRFHEPSWTKIVTRLTQLGIRVAESNRQQCYFPEGAQVITNVEGTADAFTTLIDSAKVWVLPGPPTEVAAVWRDGVEADVRVRVPHAKPLKLLTWQCLGKSEAELGEIAEKALAGSGLVTGYRAHRPYVEVKIWCTEDELTSKKTFVDALERAIAPWVVARHADDLLNAFAHQLDRFEEIDIADCASGGLLSERLGPLLRSHTELAEAVTLATEWLAPKDPTAWVQDVLDGADPSVLTLALGGFSSGGDWAVGLRDGDTLRIQSHRSPFGVGRLLERSRRMAIELSFKHWGEWLQQLNH